MNEIISDIKALQDETLLNLQNSKAKNTVRAYKSDFNDFGLFCAQNTPKSLKSDLYALTVLLALEFFRFIKVSSCKTFMSVIISFIYITIDNH